LQITPRFWLANRVTPRTVDLLFHVASAGVLSEAARQRFIATEPGLGYRWKAEPA
jgi:hypothetical protein